MKIPALILSLLATPAIADPILSFDGHGSSTTNGGYVAGQVLYSAFPLGVPAANRAIGAAVGLRCRFTCAAVSVKICDIPATRIAQVQNIQTGIAETEGSFWLASVPNGNYCDIVVTYDQTQDHADAIGVYSLYGLNSLTPIGTQISNSTTAPSLNLLTANGGIVISGTWNFGLAAPTCAWTGLINDGGDLMSDPTGNLQHFNTASAGNLTASEPMQVGCQFDGISGYEPVSFAVSLR